MIFYNGVPLPLAAAIIRRHAGRGIFIHKGGLTQESGCPHCGCRDYFAFLDDSYEGFQSSPDDVFECVNCQAYSTRRDFAGFVDHWDKDDEN